ncbi:UNVERIFIED_CONTAM: hypothetical protein RMT77_016657 [Armadillidium vulgare]
MDIGIKVTNKLPNTVEDCLIAEHKMGKRNMIGGCLTLCKNHPTCFLACHSGEICKLFSATVSSFYSPVSNEKRLSNFKCYSNWDEKKNIVKEASFTGESSSEDLGPNNVKIGYGCSSSEFNGYRSQISLEPYLRADLSFPRHVKKVVAMATRDSSGEQNFSFVKVRVGNSSDIASEENILLMSYDSTLTEDKAITFEGNESIFGRYVIIQGKGDRNLPTYLSILELKIIIE